MNFAVIQTGGKQYKVAEGDTISVEHLALEVGKDMVFDQVLLMAEDGNVTIGQPFVSGVTITGKILSHNKGEKIRVAKYKAKVRYRRVTGHRQQLSQVQIAPFGAVEKKTRKPVAVEATTA